jgi:hypothetical protein
MRDVQKVFGRQISRIRIWNRRAIKQPPFFHSFETNDDTRAPSSRRAAQLGDYPVCRSHAHRVDQLSMKTADSICPFSPWFSRTQARHSIQTSSSARSPVPSPRRRAIRLGPPPGTARSARIDIGSSRVSHAHGSFSLLCSLRALISRVQTRVPRVDAHTRPPMTRLLR